MTYSYSYYAALLTELYYKLSGALPLIDSFSLVWCADAASGWINISQKLGKDGGLRQSSKEQNTTNRFGDIQLSLLLIHYRTVKNIHIE